MPHLIWFQKKKIERFRKICYWILFAYKAANIIDFSILFFQLLYDTI